jgi:hypothetical protein
MASSFSPLMTGVLMKVPVADSTDATGMIVTVNQLALVIGVACFGAVYLNLAGALPVGAAGSFRQVSAYAEFLTCLALAAVAAAGGFLAAVRAWAHERPAAQIERRPAQLERPLAELERGLAP